jgi:hypothetical protein
MVCIVTFEGGRKGKERDQSAIREVLGHVPCKIGMSGMGWDGMGWGRLQRERERREEGGGFGYQVGQVLRSL